MKENNTAGPGSYIKTNPLLFIILGLIVAIVLENVFLAYKFENFWESLQTSWKTYLKLTLIIALYGMVLGLFTSFTINSWRQIVSKEAASQKLLDEADKKVDELEQNYNRRILERNFKQLSAYYQESLAQSSKSFVAASTMCFLGFTILAIGILLMYLGNAETSYITVAAGVIAEFLALTIFKVFKQSVEQASDYHKKLLISQNISMGIEVAETLGNSSEKDNLKAEVVKVLLQDANKHIGS